MKVTVTGLKDVELQLQRLSRAASKGVGRRAAIKAMKPMADLAASLAPDDPTTPPLDLHTSIEVSSSSKPGRAFARLFEGPTQVNVFMGPTSAGYPQAVMQEFGTVKMQAHPYMRPAWDQDRFAMLERLKDNLWIEVQKSIARAERKAARAARG